MAKAVKLFRKGRVSVCQAQSLWTLGKRICKVKDMALIVQKFGGSSVANAERVMNVAGIVTDTYHAGNDVVVVVSAQGDTTDDLIEKAHEINPSASKREMDMLLTSGEQISVALLAMAIEKLGCPVVSLLG